MAKVITLEESVLLNRQGLKQKQYTTIVQNDSDEREYFLFSSEHINYKVICEKISQFIDGEISNNALADFIIDHSSAAKEIEKFVEGMNKKLNGIIKIIDGALTLNGDGIPNFIYNEILNIIKNSNFENIDENRSWIALSNLILNISNSPMDSEKRNRILELLDAFYTGKDKLKLSPSGMIIHFFNEYFIFSGDNKMEDDIYTKDVVFISPDIQESHSLITINFNDFDVVEDRLIFRKCTFITNISKENSIYISKYLSNGELSSAFLKDSYSDKFLIEKEILTHVNFSEREEVDISMVTRGDIISADLGEIFIYVLSIGNTTLRGLSIDDFKVQDFNLYDMSNLEKYSSTYSIGEYIKNNFANNSLISFKSVTGDEDDYEDYSLMFIDSISDYGITVVPVDNPNSLMDEIFFDSIVHID